MLVTVAVMLVLEGVMYVPWPLEKGGGGLARVDWCGGDCRVRTSSTADHL